MTRTLPDLWQHLQRQLFPMLAEELGPLSELDEQFCQCVSVLDLAPLMRRFAWCENGRPPHERTWMFHAFLAKTIYQFPTTEALIDALQTRPRLRQLCGWESAHDVPSAPTFSRGFTAFARAARAAGLKLGLGTAGDPENIAFAIGGLELHDFFDAAVGAADVRHGKPEPDIFLEAARRMDVAPEQCLVFEDAPLGIEAARRAGMRAVALTTSDPDHAFSAYAHVIHVCGDYRNMAIYELAELLRPPPLKQASKELPKKP